MADCKQLGLTQLLFVLTLQGNTYWSMMYTNPYKYGFPGCSIDSYYDFGHFEVADYAQRSGERREWDNPLVVNNFDSQQTQHNEYAHESQNHGAEECK